MSITIDHNYNERPALNQLSYLSKVLENKGIKLDSKLWESNFNGLTMGRYRYLLNLSYENKMGKLMQVLKELQLINK